MHVPIARESNGSFVRTRTEWLADRVWSGGERLEPLLAQFRAEYNDRSHP